MLANALKHISIRGFKSIEYVRVFLEPINVLIGANGAGKSNFLGVFEFVHEIREGRLRAYVAKAGGAEKMLHFGSKHTSDLHISLSFDGTACDYNLMLSATADDGLFPSVEMVPLQGSQGTNLSPNIGGWRVYHVHDTSSTALIRKTANIDDNHFLKPDGSNLAAFLYLLREKYPQCYSLIRKTVQLAAPFFDDFQLLPVELKPDSIKLEWRHKRFPNQYFDASSLSDGTLRFIALATLFLQPKEYRPSIFLVDEPELGLHPAAIGLLASLIKQASVETQVIVSTQSSLLLDYFDPAEVLVANRVEGRTQIERLDPSRLAVWLEDYSLGQLWEKNELEGRPVPE